MTSASRPSRAAGERGFIPLALLLTLTLGLVDPAGMRPATPREPSRTLWSVALSRAVEALVEAGECPPNAPLPIEEADGPESQPTVLVLVTSRSIAIRGEADLPPPANA